MSNIVKRHNLPSTKNTPVDSDLVLADISSSMGTILDSSTTCYSCLIDALNTQKAISIDGFATKIFPVKSANDLPMPHGSTNLTDALLYAIECHPMGVLVVSDGAPDNRETALEAATQLSNECIVNVLYIGPDVPMNKIFMRELAEAGRGRYSEYDIVAERSAKLLGSSIASLLMLPPPTTIEL